MNQRNSDNMELGRRGVPKLGGSSAGFIVLIVALCLIIITSFIAIYFLLREHKSSDEELAQKRKPSGKASYGFPADDAGLQQKFWQPSKYRRLFSTHTHHTPERLPVRSFDDLPLQPPQPSPTYRMTSPDRRNSALTVSTSYGSNIRSLASPTSPSSVRFDTSNVRINLPFERDRFAPSPMTPPPHIYTYLSTPPSSTPSSPTTAPHRLGPSVPRISLVPSTQPVQHERDITLRSMTSSSGHATFEGGTKFIETF
ncbi:hypothetical protein AGABI1DRAFT_111648 [Agaricus bisporus var. burnettii JB137-S8]|uniref:Uncharacterized protein n=1 Tax=Agaricus bisporus var. burnettii (strain JB137-S8 / ATCC MYA-4627 / FGSC 10392) TaxID=597362 RepID=K5W8I7_AGABU|nr:uncharacterized protein AGABI1DRAFT_111648 [Agaricus bisporus var. burnettii JB137-S8]EKM83154.1 hypothetical protein AGABI1DRAFT_111648 [Agaricus bisporus var. burnettii JB137-S8]